MDPIMFILGMGVLFAVIFVPIIVTLHQHKKMDNYYRQCDEQRNIERVLKKELETRRIQYQKNTTATIDYQAFLCADKAEQSKMFSDYLLTACEENIELITQIFAKANTNRYDVESEVAAYFQFIGITLLQTADLYELDFILDFNTLNEKHGRDPARFENRVDIYLGVVSGAPVRAYWDPSGNAIKCNSNPLISCLMTMADFIWEPHLKDASEHDEYYRKPLTVKSIDKAMEFQSIYAEANMQAALFMDMVASTAQKLGILPMQ